MGLAVLGGISGGVGTAAILLAATAILMMATAILAIGTAMLQAAKGFKIFAETLKLMQNLNGKKIRQNIGEVAKALPDMLKMIIGNLDAIKTAIVGMGGILGTSFATAIFTAIETFHTLIIASSGSIITVIGDILIGIVYGILLNLKNFTDTLLKPGSVLWDIMLNVLKFLAQSAEYFGYYGFMIAVKFMEGIIKGMCDMGWDVWVAKGFNIVITAVKQKVNEMLSWCESKLNDFYAGANAMVIDSRISGYQDQIDDINDQIHSIHFTGNTDVDRDRWELLQDLQGQRADIMENMAREQQNRSDLVNYWQSEDERINQEMEDENDRLGTIYESVDEMLDAEARTRNLFDNAPNENYTGYSTYMPEQYRGLAMDSRRSTEGITSSIRDLGSSIRDFLGITEGQSIGDILMNFLGISGDNGEGIFSSFGIEAGTDYMSGLSDSLASGDLTSDSLVKINDLLKPDDLDYSEFTYALENATDLPEEASNPVISPVLKTDTFWKDVDTFEKTWHDRTYDEFAIDVGNSMTLREAANGDATTDGSVSYNFTQINNSLLPE